MENFWTFSTADCDDWDPCVLGTWSNNITAGMFLVMNVAIEARRYSPAHEVYLPASGAQVVFR